MLFCLGRGWVAFAFEDSVESDVFLAGDFNDWNETSHPMRRHCDGTYRTILKLPAGEYEFRYKCGGVWFNDRHPHKYVPNCWGSENSVVIVRPYREGDDDVPWSKWIHVGLGNSDGIGCPLLHDES